MSKSLLGRRVLLTGASRGIGLEVARLFLGEGAQVIGVAKSAERLDAAARTLAHPESFFPLVADLTQPSVIDSIRVRVTEIWGALDLLIHNAAIMASHDEEILSEDPGSLEASLEVNLLAPFRLTRALLPLLKKGSSPRIVNVSSGAGTFDGLNEPGIASYRLSKWALNGLTKLEAKELAGQVSILAFDPGWVKTDLGGPKAPGSPRDSAQSLLKTVLLPVEVTGQFFKDAELIQW
jgi:NAD(P)-dependent dehydrogenase (short-subunit alcohol dehydrogenase family)